MLEGPKIDTRLGAILESDCGEYLAPSREPLALGVTVWTPAFSRKPERYAAAAGSGTATMSSIEGTRDGATQSSRTSSRMRC